MSPAIVRDGRVGQIAGHRVHQGGKGRKAEEVVSVDRSPRSHAAPSQPVVAGRDNACHPRAVVEVPLEYAASERIVAVAGPVDVVLQVLMLVVQAIVDHGHVDPGAQVAAVPHLLDVYVLVDRSSVQSGIVQVPLAAVQRVVVVGRYRGTAVDKRGVLGVFGRHYGVGPGLIGVAGSHLDVARARVQAAAEHEAQPAGDKVPLGQMGPDPPASRVQQLSVRVHRVAHHTHEYVRRFGDRYAEIVRVACPVYPSSGQGVLAERQRAGGPGAAARGRHLDGGHRVRPGCPRGVLLRHDRGAEVPLPNIEPWGIPAADLIPAVQRVASDPEVVHSGFELLANEKVPVQVAAEEAVVVDGYLLALGVQQRALGIDSAVGARHAYHQVGRLGQLYSEVVLVVRRRVQYAAGEAVERQVGRVRRAGGVLHRLGVQRVRPRLRGADPHVVGPRV